MANCNRDNVNTSIFYPPVKYFSYVLIKTRTSPSSVKIQYSCTIRLGEKGCALMDDALENFSPLTRAWFRATYGSPTPPQAQGWLPIQRGEHTLILAPTGSGKTLAAFLWGIDELFRNLTSAPSPAKRGEKEGIQLLYVSPLKALNNDIERNLRVPLEGIRAFAAREKTHLPQIR